MNENVRVSLEQRMSDKTKKLYYMLITEVNVGTLVEEWIQFDCVFIKKATYDYLTNKVGM